MDSKLDEGQVPLSLQPYLNYTKATCDLISFIYNSKCWALAKGGGHENL
jgi:hypothetical protein